MPFLIKTKKIIINLIKNQLDEFSFFNINKELYNKIEYVLERITDSKFYFIKLKLKYIIEYYKKFLFENKEEDINIIEDILKTNKIYKIEKYLIDYENAQKTNERFYIIKFLFEQKSKHIEFSKIEFKNEWEKLENIIKQKKFEKIDDNIILIMNYYLNIEENKELFIKIFNKDICNIFYNKIKNYINNNFSRESISTNTTNESNKNNSLESENFKTKHNKNTKKIYKKVEILHKNEENKNYNKNSKKINSLNLSNNNKDEENKNVKEMRGDEDSNKNYIHSNFIDSDIIIFEDDEVEKDEKPKIKNSTHQILEFIKIIGNHKNQSESIKEIRGDKILSYGTDNNIYIYDSNYAYKKIKEINCKDWINNIEELEAKDFIKCNIVIGTKKLFYLKNLITNKEEKINLNELEINLNSFIKVRSENNQHISFYFLCHESKVSLLNYAFSKIIEKSIFTIFKGYYKEGIQIYKSLFAFTSNKIVSNGEDKIIFYNFNSGKSCIEIKNYSFILSSTGLCLISVNKNNKILLCACKKYIKGQKNGILLISDLKSIDESDYDKKNNIKFYDTKNFEVHCFCQLSKLKKKYLFKNSNIQKTIYFFVGGFDTKKNRGGVKLYKIKKNKKEIIEIDKIQDIVLENEYIFDKGFKLFKGPISCITQSTSNGNIIITCWDGNVYLFNVPYLEKIISFEEKIIL